MTESPGDPAAEYLLQAGFGPTFDWPTMLPSLNGRDGALDGSITNNMAIVLSTNGKVDAYASGITQLILDISSYFAP